MRVLTISFIIAGIIFLTLASWTFVLSGMHWESLDENQNQQTSSLLFIGTIILLLGIVFISMSFYGFGTGKPRFIQNMIINHIYEIIGKVSVGKEKNIVVLREQSGKIKLFQFDADPGVTGAKFIKIIKLKNGAKGFQSFPPSKETSSSEEQRSSEEDS